MQPIFKEYIDFLKDSGLDEFKEENGLKFKLKEGYFWLDRRIIRGYNKNGKQVKLLRFDIDNKLNLIFKTYKHYNKKQLEFLSWQDLYNVNKDKIKQLENESLNLIKNSIEKYDNYKHIILTSSGKDSNLTQYLKDKATENNTKIIFSNTSLDVAETYKYIKDLKTNRNVQIINPKEGFYQWRKRNDFIPTRFRRACCGIFKEGAMINKLDNNINYLFYMGMRNSESTGRSEYGDYWKNNKWGDNWLSVLPIRKWSELEVWLYTLKNNIPVNDKYKYGYKRVGCAIACPFYNETTWILDKYFFPTLRDRWEQILIKDFIDNEKWTNLNCTKDEYLICWNGGKIRKEPNKEVIKEFAEYKNIDLNVAKNYFNHTCDECGTNIKENDTLGMNMKYLGRNTKKYYCKKHLQKIIGIDNKKWEVKIETFKLQGCNLF